MLSLSTRNGDGISNAEISSMKQKETKGDSVWKERVGDPSHLKATQTMRDEIVDDEYLQSLNLSPGTTWRDIGIYVI